MTLSSTSTNRTTSKNFKTLYSINFKKNPRDRSSPSKNKHLLWYCLEYPPLRSQKIFNYPLRASLRWASYSSSVGFLSSLYTTSTCPSGTPSDRPSWEPVLASTSASPQYYSVSHMNKLRICIPTSDFPSMNVNAEPLGALRAPTSVCPFVATSFSDAPEKPLMFSPHDPRPEDDGRSIDAPSSNSPTPCGRSSY